MAIWVPPKVARDMLEQRQQHTAEVLQQVSLHQTLADWNHELKAIDARLQLVKADEHATHPQLKPGYYHIIRMNEGAPPSIEPVEDPMTGAYREPGAWLFERLRKGDMWSNRSARERERVQKKLESAEKRRREREREERLDELMERAKAAWNPGVHITKDIPS